MSSPEGKINDLLVRIREENNMGSRVPPITSSPFVPPVQHPCRRPNLPLGNPSGSPVRRPHVLPITPRPKQTDNLETEEKLREIMRISGNITVNGKTYKTDIKDMEEIEELGNGTCGHVIKMRHKPSGEIIAVKQMRRSGNTEESKRIIMDIEVVLKSHDCKYIVKCLGCFITEPEVWICMELMATCFDKLLKRLRQPVPEPVLGKVTVATVEALSYLKDKHGVIHRDVKPSNILLDTRGNVKLCDFGISGRLVDSMAKTRSAGCAAYMAPERIEPDPESPDYDIRADVWSLGISLVELATGVYPYKDCHSDFEVLTKVIEDDPPSLPADKDFSPEFRNFVTWCLTKEKKQRPKYAQLKSDPFIKKYEKVDVNVGEWFENALRQADAVAQAAARHTTSLSITNRQLQQRQQDVRSTPAVSVPAPAPAQQQQSFLFTNGSTTRPTQHVSRLATFHNSSNHQRDSGSPPVYQKIPEQPSYSPYHAYQAHTKAIKSYPQESPILQRRLPDSPLTSPYQPRRNNSNSSSAPSSTTPERRWRSPSGSPLSRNYLQADSGEQHQYAAGSTSPILLQRFYHQQRQQQQQQREGEEKDYGKKRYASHIKLQMCGDRSGRSSRNQSPDPPPRLNRSASGDQSPLTLRRAFLEAGSPASPSFSRRYISPTPPIPPPRRLSESTSVPGSPQHLRAHFHYTPEPQRRLFHHNSSDVS